MGEIKLSIIIPCYNVENYLPTTLQSLSNLRNKEECEFIFVNDGSTDSTLDIIESFVQQDSRSVLINQQNQGVSVARNVALGCVKGEYVLCLDGDDYLAENTVDIVKMHICDADVLLAPCIRKYSEKQEVLKLGIPDGQYTINQLYELCDFFPLAPQLIYKTSIIKSKGILFNSQIKCGEVYDFTVSFLSHATKAIVIDTPFYYYVMRSTSATQKPNYKSDISVLNVLRNFSLIKNSWTLSNSFLLTEFKLVTNFTYVKYVRHGLVDDETINVLYNVLLDNHFQKILSLLSIKSMTFKDKLYVSYIKYMPIKVGYFLCVYFFKMLKKIK